MQEGKNGMDDIASLKAELEKAKADIQELQSRLDDYPFDLDLKTEERVHRLRFFYNAFRALKFNHITGDYVEFGSHGATTFCFAYHEAQRHNHKAHLWAFDSFQGLPRQKGDKDSHGSWVEGKMATSLDAFNDLCAARNVPESAYTTVAGFYEDTLPVFAKTDAPRDVALAYIDCDLYSSTSHVMAFLKPRLKHGMIIALDDYFCWSADQISGERAALLEAFPDGGRWKLLPYLQFGWHGQAFVVEDASLT